MLLAPGTHLGPYEITAPLGIFIRNKLGRNFIRLYVDHDNQPHIEVYDVLGKTVIYELKVPHR